MILGILNDPLKSIKNHALKFWATKEFAERQLAFSRSTWILHAMYCFVIILTIDTFLIVVVNDTFTLINFYDNSDFWLINLLEEIYTGIPALVEVAILYFLFSPIIIKGTLLLSKAYQNKEKRLFEWIEFRIKRKFPSYKTSSQKARERAENPKKKGKLNIKYQKWLETKNDVEKFFIRAGLWAVYLGFFATMFFVMLVGTSSTFNELIFDEKPIEEVIDEAELIEQDRPERPTGMPPPTIYDIFINNPNTVIP